jgi:hypothetical protein
VTLRAENPQILIPAAYQTRNATSNVPNSIPTLAARPSAAKRFVQSSFLRRLRDAKSLIYFSANTMAPIWAPFRNLGTTVGTFF